MPRLGFDWHTRARPIGSEELASSMAQIMSSCIEQFGPNRCMFESNFPVDKVSFSHHVLFNAFKLFSKSYSASERAALFHDTAARAYRISGPGYEIGDARLSIRSCPSAQPRPERDSAVLREHVRRRSYPRCLSARHALSGTTAHHH